MFGVVVLGIPLAGVARLVARLVFAVAGRSALVRLPDWRVWWRAVSRLAFVVASHAVLTWRAGEGGGLILPALAKSAPTLPSPPRHPGTARCAACRYADEKCSGSLAPRCIVGPFIPFSVCPRIPVQAHTGSHGQGVSRSDNLCSQCAEDGSPLERAQSEVTPPNPEDRAKQLHANPPAAKTQHRTSRGQNERGCLYVHSSWVHPACLC